MPNATGQALLDALKQYELGLVSSISTTVKTGLMDQLSATVGKMVSSYIPGAAACVAVAAGVLKELGTLAGGGPYSTISRVGNDVSKMDIYAIYKDLFTGRTYGEDTYWGAVYYYRYVMSQNVNNQNQMSDQSLVPAMQWLMNKLGVFISGNEHLVYLNESVDKYISLHGVNSYTTTDRTRVQNAYNVMKSWMPYIEANPTANTYPGPPGAWANAVGVYDNILVGLVNGSSAYQAALQNAKQGYIATDVLPGGLFGISGNDYLYIVGIVVVVIIIIYLTI